MPDTSQTEKLYCVVTEWPPGPGQKRKLVRKRDASMDDGFWTEFDPDQIWKMDLATAKDIQSRLAHNAPQIVRAEKAVGWIEAQRALRLEAIEEHKAKIMKNRDCDAEDGEVSPAP